MHNRQGHPVNNACKRTVDRASLSIAITLYKYNNVPGTALPVLLNRFESTFTYHMDRNENMPNYTLFGFLTM